jgi:phenylalanyl-tRNA synthetase beta chain
VIDYYPAPPAADPIRLTAAEVKRIGGVDLTPADIKQKLEALEFGVEMDGDDLLVTSPDFRLDISGTHDLVEEVCRMVGFDRLPATEMGDTLPPQRGNPRLEQEERVKDILVKLGVQEIITYRLTTPEREAKLIPSSAHLPPDERPYVTLANPITVDRVALRHSLLASALETAAANSRFRERIALFEVGQIYLASEEGDCPMSIWLGDQALGTMGELHPLVIEAFEIRTEVPVIAAELDLATLLAAIPERHHVTPVAPYPAVREDLAIVVDRGITAVTVAETIKKAGGFLLQEVHLFDLYEGQQVPQGKKSLAYHLTFQAPNRTLKDKDVQKVRQRILAQLERELGAKLR